MDKKMKKKKTSKMDYKVLKLKHKKILKSIKSKKKKINQKINLILKFKIHPNNAKYQYQNCHKTPKLNKVILLVKIKLNKLINQMFRPKFKKFHYKKAF